MVEESIISAFKKAWRDLTKEERKELVKELAMTGSLGGLIGTSLAIGISHPELLPVNIPLLAQLYVYMEMFGPTETMRKLARNFEKYFGSPIHRAIKKLKEVI